MSRGTLYLRGTSEYDRALAFIDAIFGFSITLLVTTLDVPPAADWTSLGSLLGSGLGDQLVGFAISFAVIAGFWRTNHRVVATFRGLDSVTLRVLIYLVALVIFLPFTTKAISDPDPADLPLPTAVYAGNVAAVVLLSMLLVVLSRRRGLVSDGQPPLLREIAGSLLVSAVFVASIPIAYLASPDAAKYSWLGLLVISPLLGLLVRRWGRPSGS